MRTLINIVKYFTIVLDDTVVAKNNDICSDLKV